MFWGITLECGKKYTQVLQRSFHVTMAALGFENTSIEPIAVTCEINQAQYILCSLQAGKIPQQALNLIFTEGEEVSFSMEGSGEVHLTGYLLPEPQEYEYSDDEEEDDAIDDVIDDDDVDDAEAMEDEEDADYITTVNTIKQDVIALKQQNNVRHENSTDEKEKKEEPTEQKSKIEITEKYIEKTKKEEEET